MFPVTTDVSWEEMADFLLPKSCMLFGLEVGPEDCLLLGSASCTCRASSAWMHISPYKYYCLFFDYIVLVDSRYYP